MAEEIDWVLLTRYLNHTCTADERRAVHAWSERDPANAAALDDARQVWETAGSLPESWHTRTGWQAIEARLDALPTPRTARHRAFDWRAVAALAAVLLIAVALGLGIGVWLRPRIFGGREYATAPGQRETVTLADGTEFTLAPASRLRLAPSYGRTRREIEVVGEASFKVVHDPARPFVVRAANAVTEDIGTRFVVRAYPGDSVVQVVVAEGAVSLAAATHRALLRAGTLGRVDAGGRLAVDSQVDAERHLAWTRGELVFDRTPVRAVIAELSRWYGLDIQLGDPSLAGGAITASFKDESVADVLRSVGVAIGATVERNGRRVVFARTPGGQE